MHSTIPTLIAWILVAFFASAALVNFIAPAFVRETYARWRLPPRFHRVAGLVDLAAAIFLAMPVTRLWGVALAGLITFVAEVILINNKHYAQAIPGIVVLAALIPAILAGPV